MPDDTGPDADFVVAWFTGAVPDPDAYLEWMRTALDNGVRVAILGQTGLGGDREKELAAALGVQREGFVSATHVSRITTSDPDLIGFECQPDPVIPPYPVMAIAEPGLTAHLTLSAGGRESVVVATGPKGGIVADGFALCRAPEINRVRWLIDPLTFIERAFGLTTRPVPDTTTLSGRRIYFSHIDGDGWGNRSQVPIDGDDRPLSGKVLTERIFTAFPDLPLAIGMVGGELDPSLGPVPEGAVELAREVLALPNVEVAAHGYSHPIDWGYYETYDRAHEMGLVKEATQAARPVRPWQRMRGTGNAGNGDLVFFDGEVPRVFAKRAFSLDEEITGALGLASELAPEGKAARLFLWTGNARPFADAIALTRSLGVGNMNGGDSRFDGLFPSMAYLSPLGRTVSGERQIYSGNANEVVYTDGWSRNYHGQRLLAETVERTGAPRRLKPFNLYYHTFSGERHAGLRSLTELHGLARGDEFIPIWPSRYVGIANGFFSTEITQTGETEWKIENRGGLQTLRIDAPASLEVDAASSHGVIGARRVADALFVALDPEVHVARLRLTKDAVPAPMLADSRWELSAFQRFGCGFSATANGFGEGRFVIDGVAADMVEVTASHAGETLSVIEAPVRDDRVSFTLPDIARAPILIEATCLSGESQ